MGDQHHEDNPSMLLTCSARVIPVLALGISHVFEHGSQQTEATNGSFVCHTVWAGSKPFRLTRSDCARPQPPQRRVVFMSWGTQVPKAWVRFALNHYA